MSLLLIIFKYMLIQKYVNFSLLFEKITGYNFAIKEILQLGFLNV